MKSKFALLLLGVFATAGGLRADAVLAPLAPQALQELQRNDTAPFVLDVRSAEEFAAGHVPGAVNIPHDQVAAKLAGVPKDRDVVLYCRTGRRAGLAAAVLADAGYTRLMHLTGDIGGWIEAGAPVEKPKDPAACIAASSDGQPTGPACAP